MRKKKLGPEGSEENQIPDLWRERAVRNNTPSTTDRQVEIAGKLGVVELRTFGGRRAEKSWTSAETSVSEMQAGWMRRSHGSGEC